MHLPLIGSPVIPRGIPSLQKLVGKFTFLPSGGHPHDNFIHILHIFKLYFLSFLSALIHTLLMTHGWLNLVL